MFIYRKQYYNSLAYSFKSLFCGVFFLGGGGFFWRLYVTVDSDAVWPSMNILYILYMDQSVDSL